MKKVSKFAFGLLFACSMLVATAAFANDGQNGQGQNNDGQGSGSTGTSPSAPLDGGIALLLVAGVGLGVKKLLDQRKHAKHA